MIITKEMLKKAGLLVACRQQMETFATEWPNGMEITIGNLRRALTLGLNVRWAVNHLSPEADWWAYQEMTAPARQAYEGCNYVMGSKDIAFRQLEEVKILALVRIFGDPSYKCRPMKMLLG